MVPILPPIQQLSDIAALKMKLIVMANAALCPRF
jgi:hypothetical protein